MANEDYLFVTSCYQEHLVSTVSFGCSFQHDRYATTSLFNASLRPLPSASQQ
jgi:hypothetical protein